MAGLVPAIHRVRQNSRNRGIDLRNVVAGRHKAGHDSGDGVAAIGHVSGPIVTTMQTRFGHDSSPTVTNRHAEPWSVPGIALFIAI